MNNFLKFIIKVTFWISVLIGIVVTISSLVNFDWTKKQYNKLIGCYYIYIGDKSFKKRDLTRAIENYHKGLEYYPNHSQANCNLGNLYVLYEDYSSAVYYYEKAIEYKPDFLVCRINLGIILANKLLDYQGAIEQYEAVVKANPKIINLPRVLSNKNSVPTNKGLAYYNMGLAYRALSLLEIEDQYLSKQYLVKSRNSYRNASKYLKNNVKNFYNLGLSNHMLKNYKEAGQNYCKAIKLEPFDYEIHYNLALLLRSMEKYRESLDELEKVGLILSNDGDGNKSSYIFDIITEVSQKISTTDGHKYLVERLSVTDDGDNSNKLSYINGKVVLSDDLDKAIYENMQKCSGSNYFNTPEEN